MILLIIGLIVAMCFTVIPEQMRFNQNNKEMPEEFSADLRKEKMLEGMDFSDMPESERLSMPDEFNREISEKQDENFERRKNRINYIKLYICTMFCNKYIFLVHR